MRKKPKIFLAVAAAVLSVIAGSGAFALAAPATEKPYTVEENYTVGDKTGVKITARVSKNAAAYDYPGYIDIENQSEIVELRMLPEEEGTAEAEMAVITLTDALDTARSLGVIVATGGRWWDCKATYVTASFGGGFTSAYYGATDSFGVGTIGLQSLLDGKYGTAGYADLAGWKGDYNGFFAGSEARPISSARFTLEDGKINVYTDYNASHNRKTVADIRSEDFLSYYRNKYLAIEQTAEAAKYTADYARNLFPSGKAKLSVSFGRTTASSVSFGITSAGGKAVTEIKDTEAPAIGADLTTRGVKGYFYALPEISVIDDFDGRITDYTVSVADPEGNAVGLTDGGFTPEAAGNYTLSVSATDAAGNTGTKTVPIEVFDTVPEVSWNAPEVSIRSEYCAHEKITVPAASATSPLAVGNDGKIAVYAELAIGNETIAREPASGAPATLTIPRSGEYTLRYVAIDGAGAEHTLDRASFTAIDRPVILEADEETVQVGYPYEIEKKLCYYLGGEYPTGYAVFDGTTGERVSVTDGAFAPTRAGTYFIRYFATVDGVPTERVLRLNAVASGWYLLDGEKFTVKNGYKLPVYANDKGSGLLIATAETNTFSVKNKINLSALAPTDDLIRFTPLRSESIGYGGASSYTVTLTDALDPSNRVVIRAIAHSELTKYAYVYLNYDGRTLARYSEYDGAVRDWDGFGCLVTNGMGRAAIGNPFYIRYDNAEKAFYIDCHGSNYQLLAPCDGEQVGYGKEWKGFTSGEVYMEVSIGCNRPSAVVLTAIGGQNLGGESLSDVTAPVVAITAPERFVLDGDRMPDGEVNKFYPLPAFSAYDFVSGEREVAISLTRGGEIVTAALTSGGFTPSDAGEYVYRAQATDEAGNATEIAYRFTVCETLPPVSITLGAFDETSVKAGSRFTIPSLEVSGGSGEKTVSFKAYLNDEPIEPDDLNRVYLTDRGELKIVATATDYLSTETTETLVIDVLSGDKPVIEVRGVPHAAFAETRIVLPDFTVTDYSRTDEGRYPDKFVAVDGTIVYSVSGGEESGSLTLEELTIGKHTIKYCAGTETDTLAEEIFEIEIVSASDPTSFFVPYDYDETCGGAVTSGADGNGIYNISDGNKAFRFVNPVSADGFTARFSGLAAHGSQTSTDVVFTDLLDPSVSVRFRFAASDKKTFLRVGGTGKEIGFDGSIREVDKYIEFGFDAASNYVVSASGSKLVAIERDESGAIFRGFPSGAVIVSFELRGVGEDGGSVNVLRLGNQVFGTSGGFTDNVGPQIGYLGSIVSGTVSKGTTITLPAAYARDVITGSAEATLTVKRGSKIADGLEEVPATEARTFTFDRYGYYTVTYYSTDGNDNTTRNAFTFYCRDDVSPEITVDGTLPETAVKGSEITLPSATVTDNYSEATLTIYVTAPDGSTAKITDGKLKFELVGKYRVTYFAADADYNTSGKTFIVEVKR